MKNRSKHFREAVRLLDQAEGEGDEGLRLRLAVEAVAHATLASIADLSRLQYAGELLSWVNSPCTHGCDCGECYSRSPDDTTPHHCETT